MRKKTWPSILAGAAAGLANGLFGAGGGLLLIPILSCLCKTKEKTSFATSLSVLLPLCLISLGVSYVTGTLSASNALPYLIGGGIGGLMGGFLMKKIPARWLGIALSLLLFWGGLRLWRS